jgi:TP901 family phage tail tape measure protein
VAKKSSVISVLITGDSKQLSGAVDEANSRLSKLGSVVGVAAKAVGAGLAALGAVAVREFAKFDAAMQKSIAIMGDVSDTLRKDMSDAARQVAKTTTFSAEQAAESYFFLASAGLDAAASIAAMPKVAAFAQAGMFDMALATDLLTDAQSALGMVIRDDAVANMEQMVRLSDVLVKANTLANASVEQFSTALTTKAGAALRAVNKDVEEGVAVLAAFADQGIKGELAGTQFSIVMRDLTTKALANGEAFRRFNVRVFDAEGNMRNMADIVSDLEGALDGMSDATAKATLLQLGFSDKSLGALMALMGTSEQIRIYEAALRDAGGTTDEIAKKQLETFSAQMSLLKSLFQDAAIEVGSALVPALMKIVEWVQKNGPRFTEWVEGAAVKVGEFIDKVGEKAAEFKTFFDERLREPLDNVRTAIDTFVDRAKAKFAEFSGAVPGAVRAFTDFISEVRALAANPEALGEQFGQALGNAIEVALGKLVELSSKVSAAVSGLLAKVDWFRLGMDAFKYIVMLFAGLAVGFGGTDWFSPLLSALAANWPQVLLALVSIMFMPAKWAAALTRALGRIPIIGKLLGWMVTALNTVGQRIAVGFSNWVWQPLSQAISRTLAAAGPGVIARFLAFFRGIPAAFRTAADDVLLRIAMFFDNFGVAIANGALRVRGFLARLMQPFTAFGKMLTDDLYLLGRNVIDALIRGLRSMGSKLFDVVKSIGRSVWDTLSKLWKISSPSKVFMGIGEDAMAGLALGLAGSERMLRELTGEVGSGVLPQVSVGGGVAGGTSIVVNVSGAVDPEGTARQIRRILQDAERRSGVRVLS